MASWGIKSYANDGTYNYFGPYPSQMTEYALNNSIQRSIAHYHRKSKPGELEETPVVGTVIFCIDIGHKIKTKSHLELALEIARKWTNNKDYLNDWKTPKQRKARLEVEIKTMEKALDEHNKR
jgi:hypothetical protein